VHILATAKRIAKKAGWFVSQRIDSFGPMYIHGLNSSITTKKFHALTYRLPPEVFIRRVKTSNGNRVKTKRAFIKSQRSSTSTEYNNRLLPTMLYKKTINWVDASVIDREPDRPTRWIKEAIHVRKEGQRAITVNRQLPTKSGVRLFSVFLAHPLLAVPRTG